jgi:beta-glucanase (GH16 family)
MQKTEMSIQGIQISRRSFVERGGILLYWGAFAIIILLHGFTVRASAQSWGNPTWSDEFNATVSGTPPDPSKWTFDAGGDGWGNRELEVYCVTGSATPAPCNITQPNAFQDGHGHLIIQAVRTSSDPAPSGTWTSARLKTLGLQDFQYGRLESCMKLPVGAGLWPAFWMLGTHGEWPTGGEMDIMENVPATGGAGGGLGPTVIESTIHGPSTAQKGIYSLAADFTLPNGKRIDDADPSCHVYGAIWSPFMVQIYVDDWRKPFFIRTASDVPPGGRWIFNAPFYFIMNLAVGGEWPGPPDDTTPSPSKVVVDYVRVYKPSNENGPGMSASPISMKGGSTGSTALRLTSLSGSGYVYLACSTASPNATCSVDTGNSLNASAADFGEVATQMAKVTVVRTTNSGTGSRVGPITITAYTVSGDQSTLSIPADNP